jgi:hypothetical protein
MLVNPFVKQATLRFRERKACGFLGDFVPQLLNQTDLLARGQFPERLDDRFCIHGATLRNVILPSPELTPSEQKLVARPG